MSQDCEVADRKSIPTAKPSGVTFNDDVRASNLKSRVTQLR